MCVSHQHLIKMTSKLIFIARRSGFQIGILTDGFLLWTVARLLVAAMLLLLCLLKVVLLFK